jgi:hypothetical protein
MILIQDVLIKNPVHGEKFWTMKCMLNYTLLLEKFGFAAKEFKIFHGNMYNGL